MDFLRPEEERTFNTTEIARLLNISITSVGKFARRMGIEPKIVQNKTHAFIFNWTEYKLIQKEVQQNKKINAMKNKEKTLYEKESDHPLVTDKRLLNLYYFPDVIPDCFKTED